MESPGVGLSRRNTSIVVVTLDSGEVYIVTSLSCTSDTQVIYIDPTTGALRYRGRTGYDIFNSEAEALKHITNGSRSNRLHARAILGYSALGTLGLLLVATKLSASIPNLPGGGCVYTVAESQWIKVSLQNPQPQGKSEVKSVEDLTELDIDGKHYFCETRDITRPFPSRMPLKNPDEEFVWNGWFSESFKNIGLPQHCVILLQGFAECRNFGSSGQLEGFVALTARRSRLHPGTRYLARGLNSCCSTGNEVECEQLVWVPRKSGQSVPFNTYIWRRGTIPMWWGAELKMTAAEAEIYVSDRDPYKGSSEYYQRLSRRYDARSLDTHVEGSQTKKTFVPIVCINLLRNGEGKSESILVQHFEESINYIRTTGKLPYTRIHLINYDWHASTKLKGEQQTIEGLWKLLKAPTISIGINEGDYLPSRQRVKDCTGEIIINDDFEGAFCLRLHQNGVIRFNCADSLDRTKAASYFGALQVFMEQCRRLGISLDSGMVYGYQSTNNYGGYIAPLPPGWEKRSDAVTGKTYFIDHNTKTTTWTHPCPDKPWKRLDMTFEEFKRSTILSPVSQLADIFLLAGDIHATLYTGSKAMHSQILGIFNEDAGKFKQFSAAQNMKINLQRRYKNVVVDSSRQKQLEMFLGIRLFKHLPSLPFHPLHVLSRPPGCFLKPVASMFPSPDSGESLLSFKRKDLIWVCPKSADAIEMFIYLGEPCHVCQLLLTISHGADDSTFPSTCDVRTGRSLDELQLVMETSLVEYAGIFKALYHLRTTNQYATHVLVTGASIPRCNNGTNLLLPLPGPISPEDMAITGAGARLFAQETSTFSSLYEFEELEGRLDFLTRVVAVTFYPTGSGRSPMTLGEIEVLGVTLPWRSIFTNENTASGIRELHKNFQKDPFLSSVESADTNPFFVPSSNEHLQPPLQSNASADLWVDLLTGGDILPHHDPVPVMETAVSKGDDFLSFLDESALQSYPAVADSKLSSKDDVKPFHTGAQKYINCLKSFAGQHMERKLNFTEAMKVEIERLRLDLSSAERDRALLSIGTDPASINPNLLLDEFYMRRLCRVSSSLALLGQLSTEDKTIAAIGLEGTDDSIVDFWNISGTGENCAGGQCQVCAETDGPERTSSAVSSLAASEVVLFCYQCKRKVCKVCCAGKGALLLGSFNSREVTNYNSVSSFRGSSQGNQVDVSTNAIVTRDDVICKDCCNKVVLDALILDYVRVLISLRRSTRANTAACEALTQVIGVPSRACISGGPTHKLLRQLIKGEESLAEFPLASFLQPVETAANSAPLLSLLAPLDSSHQQSYWRSPPNTNSVEFIIVLGGLSDVSGVILLVSSCGYSVSDTPSVQIWASDKMQNEEKSCLGKWDVQSMISSTSEFYGAERLVGKDAEPRHLKFAFKNPARCRILWITVRLQRPGSSSFNFEKDLNLLSFDENPFSELNRRASFGGSSEAEPCIHAKRILVVGRPVRKDNGLILAQGSDQINVKNWLERSPQLIRFRIPVESERSSDSNLVLEQNLSPASPLVAGFRLDAFSAIKPRVTHSPSSVSNMPKMSMTFLEDRHISPAVLYIQASILQDSQNTIVVAEYRLPEAKAGTAMYFDFPRKLQSRRITFKLLGDVTAFADDPAEQDDSDIRNPAVAAGLSLINRIKLYYYADPYEQGKWVTSLSTV